MSWLETRLVLLFCAAGKLKSTLLDFDQAFVQADAKSDVLMKTPSGHDAPNGKHVLKLKKNFNGLSDGNAIR